MRNVLYLHGFASSPASAKITSLRPMLEPYAIELVTPDLNVPSFEHLDFDAIVARVVDAAQQASPRALVGSSLGALIALEGARRGVTAPMVLIAPALGVAPHWLDHIPSGDPVMTFNFARNCEAPIHRAFFEQIARVDADVQPPAQRVTVLMGRNDQTVPFTVVHETWEKWEASGRLTEGSRFITIEDGDHSLVAYADMIRDAIVDAAAR